jgi:hypothetical protein
MSSPERASHLQLIDHPLRLIRLSSLFAAFLDFFPSPPSLDTSSIKWERYETNLVEPDVLLQPSRPDGVQDPKRTESIDVAGVLCHLERDLDVRLRAEVVDLGGHDLGDDVDEVGGVCQVAVVKDHLGLVV